MESTNLIAGLAGINPLYIFLALVWSMVWKGFALWRAAELRQKYWFVAILLVNTFGLLEIIYLFLIAKKYQVEVIEKSE